MPSYLIPPHLVCPLSGEPLVEPVVIVGVHAPEKTPTLRLGETVDLQSLRDMFKNGSTGALSAGALSAACSFVRNRTVESAIEDFACQKLAESLPISSLQEVDVHPTVAAVLGQILAQHELASWHDWARELALAPSRESLTSLAAIMARKNKSWKVMQREFVCVNRQKEWQRRGVSIHACTHTGMCVHTRCINVCVCGSMCIYMHVYVYYIYIYIYVYIYIGVSVSVSVCVCVCVSDV